MEHFLFRMLFEMGCSIFEALALMALLKGSFCCFIPVLFASSFWERRTALDMGGSVLLAVFDLISCFVGVLFESVLFFGRSVVDGDGGGEDVNKEEEDLVVRLFLTTTHHASSSSSFSFSSSSLLSSSIRLIIPFVSVVPLLTFGSTAGLLRVGLVVDGSNLAPSRSALSSFTSLPLVSIQVVPLGAVHSVSSCRSIPTIVASFFSALGAEETDGGGFCEGSRAVELLEV